MNTIFKYLFGPILLFSLVFGGQRTIVRFGQDVEVSRDQTVESAVALGGDVRIEGRVTEDAVAIGGNVYLGPTAIVKGNVVSVGGRVYPEPGAEIDGDLVEVGSFQWRPGFWYSPHYFFPFSFFMILSMLGFVAIGILVMILAPGTFQSLSTRLETDLTRSFLYGLVQVLLIVPVILFLVVTIIGIALIPVLIITLILVGIFGYFITATVIGRRLLVAFHKTQSSLVVQFILGILLLWIVGLVPGLGKLIKFGAYLVGFGVIGLVLVERRKARSASFTQPEQLKETDKS